MTPSGFVISGGGLLLSLLLRYSNKLLNSAVVVSHIPSNSVVSPDLPDSSERRIRDRGNINVPSSEGSCPHKRQESNSEDDEDVCESGHEVHNVVDTRMCCLGVEETICLRLTSSLLSF